MNLDAYPCALREVRDDRIIYTFDSFGPNGRIRKIVRYRLKRIGGFVYFNLGFGDLDPVTGKVDDRSNSNNSDREKVLATIAATVLDFTRNFPDAFVFAQGSTSSRTRLYQIGISASLEQISAILNVYGFLSDSGWQPYQKNINYLAFLARRK